MTAIHDLALLLRQMQPVLHPDPCGIALWPADQPRPPAFALIEEAEGTTVIAPLAVLDAAGVRSDPWARITLTVHSDLAAVGLTAAFATALAARGISANVVAGFHHDHILVQWDRRGDAMAALKALSDG